jgi:(p)ppGpp synthase/HD superfamily hydrolase
MSTRGDFLERSPLTRDALAFAEGRHEGQTRDFDELPFVTHPLEVARLLYESGYSDEVVAAGVLHDVLENTDAERADLDSRFGTAVTWLVASVSDDPSIEDAEKRKAALRRQVAEAGERAAAIFAADKVSKTRELGLRVSRGDFGEADRAKAEHYEQSLEMLSEIIPDHDLVAQLRRELEALPMERIRAGGFSSPGSPSRA